MFKLLKIRVLSLLLILVIPILSFAQSETKTANSAKVVWSKSVIDSTLNPTCCDKLATTEIIMKYKPSVDALAEPIGTCPTGLERGYPESPLSNWAVDALYDYARNYLDTTNRADIPLDFALINMGGIRTEMPQGEVTSLDIMAIFPFNNFLVILELPGKKVLELMQFFAKTNIQAMSHVKLNCKNGEIEECIINGEPLNPNKTYYVATIDFLRDGGDKLVALSGYRSQIETGDKVMDVILKTVKNITANGREIEKKIDGRVVTDKEYKKL